MKIRADILRVYKAVHTWTGIIAGLALFIAFYAGAITMFEVPLQRWASPPVALGTPPPLEDAQRLIDATLAAHPEAGRSYRINIETGPDAPARMSWQQRAPGSGRDAPASSHASGFAPDGSLEVVRQEPASVAELIDLLHQQIGLLFAHELAMPVMGVIALLYALALVSGVIVLLPTLVRDLFAMRLGGKLKRMWLDLHNVLGVLSLPFHLIMALTAIIFAFHDPIYEVQNKVSYDGRIEEMFVTGAPATMGPVPGAPRLTPAQILTRVHTQAPGFNVTAIDYSLRGDRPEVRVIGTDPRYGHRAATHGFATIDPWSGAMVSTDYLPGHQDGWYATIAGFFALHFGNFGGSAIQWAYFLLGLAGAFLFYTGNLLWIESRRRRARRGIIVQQQRATHVMASLSIGVTAGCMAGISLTIAAAKWLPGRVDDVAGWHAAIYYAVFLAAVGWALLRGAARAAGELLWVCTLTTLAIPVSSIGSALGWLPGGWNHEGGAVLIDIVALGGAIGFGAMAQLSRARASDGQRDSVWAGGAHPHVTAGSHAADA